VIAHFKVVSYLVIRRTRHGRSRTYSASLALCLHRKEKCRWCSPWQWNNDTGVCHKTLEHECCLVPQWVTMEKRTVPLHLQGSLYPQVTNTLHITSTQSWHIEWYHPLASSFAVLTMTLEDLTVGKTRTFFGFVFVPSSSFYPLHYFLWRKVGYPTRSVM
jgi:hypothetical protein